MDESLIEDEHLSVEERSVLPKPEFFVLDSMRDEWRESEFAEQVKGNDTVMLVDGDADGLAAVVLGREVFGDELGYVTTSPNELGEAVDELAEHVEDGATVFVVDLCPDSLTSSFEMLADRAEVHWYDHHEWDASTRDALESLGVDVVVGESDEVCSADVAMREFEGMGHDFDEATRELVEVTRDHDLWINADPRSEDLADLSVYLSSEEYIEAVDGGVDFDEEHHEFLRRKRGEKDELVRLAVERAEFHDVADVTVALTYGRCSQNDVAEKLRKEGADAVGVVKPEGGTSLRGSDGFERCHEVARLLGGGGHPKAAGCKPDVFDTMLDYAEHWVSNGERARERVLEAFEEL